MSPGAQAARMAGLQRRRRQEMGGFSYAEVIIVIAIIGMINGLTIAFTSSEWQRERVNGVALALGGWLEEVRGNALRKTSATTTAGGCVVTLSSLSGARSGTDLATVSPADCATSSTLLIPGVAGNPDRFNIASSNGGTITFTPRGSVTATSDADIRILLAGSGQMRCVRVSAILGLIRVGSNSAATTTADACSDYSHF
ncbi:MAG: hypothetical protein ACKOXO_03645 [Cyanobium sp.]